MFDDFAFLRPYKETADLVAKKVRITGSVEMCREAKKETADLVGCQEGAYNWLCGWKYIRRRMTRNWFPRRCRAACWHSIRKSISVSKRKTSGSSSSASGKNAQVHGLGGMTVVRHAAGHVISRQGRWLI